MKNVVVCKNCKSENPFYGLICLSCKSYLREKVYNIDLWKTISQLVETPTAGFKSIIFSEHKNFIILIILLISGKFFIDGIFFSLVSLKEYTPITSYFINYLVILVLTSVLISVVAGLLKSAIKRSGIETRFGDNFSIISYSFLPHAFGVVILFPVELILFGKYLFSTNPSPFVLKETFAYIMLGFEGLIIFWSLLLTFFAVKTQSNNKLFSFVSAIIIHGVLFSAIYFVSVNVFK